MNNNDLPYLAREHFKNHPWDKEYTLHSSIIGGRSTTYTNPNVEKTDEKISMSSIDILIDNVSNTTGGTDILKDLEKTARRLAGNQTSASTRTPEMDELDERITRLKNKINDIEARDRAASQLTWEEMKDLPGDDPRWYGY